MEAARRANFDRIVRERGDLAAASEDVFFPGQRLLTTAHAVYRLLDSVCIAVDDLGMTGRPVTLVGMQLVGWIPLAGDAVIDTWEPGASALFARFSTMGTPPKLALTSAVLDVVSPSIAPPRESYVRETRVSVPRPDVSFGPPQRRSSVNNIHALMQAQAAQAARSTPPPPPPSVHRPPAPSVGKAPLPPRARRA